MATTTTKSIINDLFNTWCSSSPDAAIIKTALLKKNIEMNNLDHFAIIDLPGPYSGIPVLREIFSDLGYEERGKDYLADKQNDFLWMAEKDCFNQPAKNVLPQVVVADFRLDEMPGEIRKIIYHYSCQTSPTAVSEIKKFGYQRILQYFSGRDWPLPAIKEFSLVREFNELLAWVLVFGRRPNHFTLSIHLMDAFADLESFHAFVLNETKLLLNQEGGVIKGGIKAGMAQGSTVGISQKVQLSDGEIYIPTGFVEFVFRYPLDPLNHQGLWGDYFTDFIARHADRVIESLYDVTRENTVTPENAVAQEKAVAEEKVVTPENAPPHYC